MSSSDAEIAARLQMEENLKAQVGGGGRRTVRGRVSNCMRQQLLFSVSFFFFLLTTITNIFFHFLWNQFFHQKIVTIGNLALRSEIRPTWLWGICEDCCEFSGFRTDVWRVFYKIIHVMLCRSYFSPRARKKARSQSSNQATKAKADFKIEWQKLQQVQ